MARSAATLAAALVVLGCSSPNEYGIEPLHAGKTTVYFVREVRGMNYDSLALSATPDPCNTDSPANYVDETLGPIDPLVRWDGRVLHLYSTSLAKPPRTPFPVRVEQHQVPPVDWPALEADPRRHGLRRIRVPLAPGSC